MQTKCFSTVISDKLWMGIWVHPYTVTLVQVGVDFWKIYVGWARAML